MRALALTVVLLALPAVAARAIALKTYDGRDVRGELVMETQSGLLVRTDAGNVLVRWEEIAASDQPTTAAPAASPSRPPPPPPGSSPLRLGVSFGVGAGPTGVSFYSSGPKVWAAGVLALIIDLEFSRLGLRFTTPIQLGPLLGYYQPFFQLFAGLDTQVRFLFSPRVSSGLGLQLGLAALSGNSPGAGFSGGSTIGVGFTLGPTLTLLAVRLGAARQHELSLSGSLQLAPLSSGVSYAGSLASIAYALLF